MELLFLGLIGGAILSYFIFLRFSFKRSKSRTNEQSVVLLEKIKKVSKLITVVGEFSEIYHHENTQEKWMGMFTSKKKALILINAKVHIGFDFRKIKMIADKKKKQILLSEFPEPEVLSIEPDLRFYDMKNGLLNKFDSADLTNLNREAKNHILQKIPDSKLIQTANQEALEAILLMQSLVETIGWTLNYDALELPTEKIKLLEE